MSEANFVLPPFGKDHLIGIWIGTLLYGINCLLFGAALYVLWKRRLTAGTNVVLLVSTVLLFAFSSFYNALSLWQLLEAFTDPRISTIPRYSDIYFAMFNDRLTVAKSLLYAFNVLTQDLLLLWRLYVVWERSWLIVILPFLIEVGHITAAFVAVALSAVTNDVTGTTVKRLGTTAWSMDIIFNTTVTLAIAGRLWWASRKVHGVQSRTGGSTWKNSYAATIFTFVESGAIFATSTIIVFGLYMGGYTGFTAGIDAVTQLATITPLLIIVRVGLGLSHGDTTKANTAGAVRFKAGGTSQSGITVDISRTQQVSAMSHDYALDSMSKA